jgi:nicotinate-nucleotide pyrophosphorylase (carboxylating)
MLPPPSAWHPLVERALAEDLGSGDVTSRGVLAQGGVGSARIEARQHLIVCGLPVATAVFAQVDPSLVFEARLAEGESADPGTVLARVQGRLISLLAAERTALNFLYRMCGISSVTRAFVDAVEGTGVRILDTRKTVPGWRVLDKYAVGVGGGANHRMGLFDGILIKDNHVAAAGGVGRAVAAMRRRAPAHLRIQVEVESLAQAEEALKAGADDLLLDNRNVAELRDLARRLRDRITLEATGGITLANVREVAETGVHRISVGALTHSAPGADLALEIEAPGVPA